MTTTLPPPTYADLLDLLDLLPSRISNRISPLSNGCWEWTGGTYNGYGRIKVEGRTWRVHRLVYITLNGPIPGGLQPDHTCHTLDLTCAGGPTCPHRRCCNPQCLELVTSAENTRRGRTGSREAAGRFWRSKTHCPRGHAYDASNTGRTSKGGRYCRCCARDRMRANRASTP